jgi:uncharacterized SAM-binding protein YcdF (DUF218 family)
MPGRGQRRFRAIALRAIVALAACGLLLSILFLPFAGRYLVKEDPLQKSDAILVLSGERVQRWLEAVDLYHEGWAPRIVLSQGHVEDAEIGLRKRGVRFPSETDLIRDALHQLNVPSDAILVMPGSMDNTAQEGNALASLAADQHWRRIIVVTSKYHTRRARFACIRALRGTGTTVVMHATQYDPSTPERWWTRRADGRDVLSELEKLVAYRLGLGG